MKDTYIARRKRLMADKGENTAVVIFSGIAPMKSQDEAYAFAVDRNFFYLTGIERENMILVMRKDYLGHYSETLFIEPYDELLAKYGSAIRMHCPIPDALAEAMANYMYLATFSTKEELDQFFSDSVAVW